MPDQEPSGITRRQFVKSAAVGAAGLGIGALAHFLGEAEAPKKMFGIKVRELTDDERERSKSVGYDLENSLSSFSVELERSGRTNRDVIFVLPSSDGENFNRVYVWEQGDESPAQLQPFRQKFKGTDTIIWYKPGARIPNEGPEGFSNGQVVIDIAHLSEDGHVSQAKNFYYHPSRENVASLTGENSVTLPKRPVSLGLGVSSIQRLDSFGPKRGSF